MKNEIIKISKSIGIDIIGMCNIRNLIVDYDKYRVQDSLKYKCSFQVGDVCDKDLSSELYNEYNSAIVIGIKYDKQSFKDKSKVYFSSFSIGMDYHIILNDKLKTIGEYLIKNGYKYSIYVDNNSLDERLLAYNAGLGFFGKNNLLINEKLGSYFFIGVLLTDALLESDKIINKKCIGCNLCINECPTKALNKYGILNSNKCLSYLTQKKGEIKKYKKYFNNCIYGCDKCISVCPYNKNNKGIDVCLDISEFLNMSEEEYNEIYHNNASYWRGKKVIDRNINYYINNLKK